MNSKIITYVTAILLLLTLSACSKNVTNEDYTEEQLRELIIGSWSCHPSDYLCDTYNLDHGTEITLEVISDGSLIIKKIPITMGWVENQQDKITIINGRGSWRLNDYNKYRGNKYKWELEIYPNNVKVIFPIDIKKKDGSIHLDYIEDPEYPSQFVFQKSK
ncbi:MAG: hypothetical protein JW739_08190 [Opitutales bacterium]|nr:hypothetical protein [Opitutales bacterium]